MMIEAELELRIPEEIEEELKDEEYDSDSDCSVTEEGCRIYGEHVHNSSGFDVPVVPGFDAFGIIIPFDHTCDDVLLYARLAVDEYNRRYKDERGELQFVRVLKSMSQFLGVFRNFVTFEAVDVSSGETKVFQSVVDEWETIDITGFRLKPPESGEGSEAPRPWLWRDDSCLD